ncbi:hypothetical protein ACJX0J_036040, partial [Zea mays]
NSNVAGMEFSPKILDYLIVDAATARQGTEALMDIFFLFSAHIFCLFSAHVLNQWKIYIQGHVWLTLVKKTKNIQATILEQLFLSEDPDVYAVLLFEFFGGIL